MRNAGAIGAYEVFGVFHDKYGRLTFFPLNRVIAATYWGCNSRRTHMYMAMDKFPLFFFFSTFFCCARTTNLATQAVLIPQTQRKKELVDLAPIKPKFTFTYSSLSLSLS
jgi:hypothetical protein